MDKGRRPHVEGSLEGPHARHESIQGDEANSWRSPAPSWYPRRRTRPPPVRFSVFRLVSAPRLIGPPIPQQHPGFAQEAKGLCYVDSARTPRFKYSARPPGAHPGSRRSERMSAISKRICFVGQSQACPAKKRDMVHSTELVHTDIVNAAEGRNHELLHISND